MSKVTVIPATINPLTRLPAMSAQKRRTAGYARVSTDSDEQFTSYEAQVDYYTKFIKAKPEWEFVKVYTDEGISGTNTKHRDGFNEMIKDALDGKIDLIVTKSVSRFARNTVDSLSTIRKLKEHNVECYFEKENIWTFDSKGELLITIMSSLAQEESRSISENVTWGHRKNFSDGKVYMPYNSFLGYEKGANGTPIINEEEAKTVRLIYRLFLDGKTPASICRTLEELGILSPRGKAKWSDSTVRSILANEKYKGDAILQKKFTVDFLQKKMKINEGEVPQYYVENSHPAIIPKEEWDMVQAEIQRRKDVGSNYSSASVFSSKLICEDCGSFYGSKVWHSTDKYRKTIWQCNRKFKNKEQCKTPILENEHIEEMFIKAYNNLMVDRKGLIADCELMRKLLVDTSELDTAIKEKTKEIEDIVSLIRAVINENATTAQSQESYMRKYDELTRQYSSKADALENLQEKRADRLKQDKELKAFIRNIKKEPQVIDTWDDTLWRVFIDKGIVHHNGSITFVFRNGKEITVEE